MRLVFSEERFKTFIPPQPLFGRLCPHVPGARLAKLLSLVTNLLDRTPEGKTGKRFQKCPAKRAEISDGAIVCLDECRAVNPGSTLKTAGVKKM